ncbi:MAG TPA: family 2 glycosyl transferase [Ktedonobacter sp.]|jgi:glycosyltransferase involved in cell wall biosynthesis|nr:family 2 glycosyl transferase [Ktedonobacter sp.]
MNDVAPTISVIICAYTEERWTDLVAAVASIQQQRTPPCETIVVIDHNLSLLARARNQLPGIVVIENVELRGLSGARNSGIAAARGTYIAFLDDDAIAEPDWLTWLSHYCENSQVLGVGGKVEPLWSGKQPTWFPEEFYWVTGCSYRGLPETMAVVRNPYGGCTCYRREVFEVVGGFRHGIGRVGKRPLGGEETELCIRARQYWPQKIFICEPRATIQHRISIYRASWHYFCSRCYAEGLSKAIITRYVSKQDTLASERTYVQRTLPQGIVRGLTDTFVQHDLTGLKRASAIVAGLAVTMTGYLIGRAMQQLATLKSIITREKGVHHSSKILPPIAFKPRNTADTPDTSILVRER